MKKKIIGIFVITLLIATVLPTVGNMQTHKIVKGNKVKLSTIETDNEFPEPNDCECNNEEFLNESFDGTFPPDGWSTDDFIQYDSNLAGGESPEAKLKWEEITEDYSYLSSKPVDTTSAETLTLEFKSFVNYALPSFNCTVLVRADGSDTWSDVTPWLNPIEENVGPDTYIADISAFIGTATQVMFEFSGYHFNIWDWYIDDFILYYLLPEEGLLIDAFFQPVQVVYQDDPEYPTYPHDTDMSGECSGIVAGLEMVAGKNTLLFGHPYEKRHEIKIQVCNKYPDQKTFQFVMKISPDGDEIWRSEWVTVPPGKPKVFTYGTPFPPTGPFKWDIWPDDKIKEKEGNIILYLEPDPGVKEPAPPCKCTVIQVNVTLVKTHDLNILWLPFTFEDGPEFPLDLIGQRGSEFDQWVWESLWPWWNGVYPLREGGLKEVRSLTPIKTNIILDDGTVVSNSETFAALNRAQVFELWRKLFDASLANAWLGSIKWQGYDRVVWLISPDIIRCPADANNDAIEGNGLAHRVVIGCSSLKFGVLVNWNTRSNVAAHEISHTYGLDESYRAGQQNRAVGYWVNRGLPFGSEKADVLNSSLNRDLMYYTWPIWEEPGRKTWIKKYNYGRLLVEFNLEEDPEVLGISGCIDKNGDVRLHPWYKLDEGNIDLEWGTRGSYLVKAYDSNGELLNEAGFNVSFTMYVNPEGEIPIDETTFAFRVEWIDGMHRVDIVNVSSNQVIATRTITPNTPQISIISPQPGETIKPEPYEITWDATDLDGDTMTYHIFLSNDSGASWFPMSLALHENSFTADFTHLSKENYQIAVFATDGWNVGEDVVSFEIKKGKDKNMMLDIPFLNQLLKWFPLLARLLQFPIFNK